MKFAIVSKKDAVSVQLAEAIKQKLLSQLAQECAQQPDVVISIGGDGTMLRAMHDYLEHANVWYVGIHTGTLGFFTNYTADEADKVCHQILTMQPDILCLPVLEIQIEGMPVQYAINELRIENVHHTQAIAMYIDHEYLQTFRGNGICLSTSIGSTGYNRSLKGPIVDPALPVMILSEVAGIQHRAHRSLNAPLVMGKGATFQATLQDTVNTVFGIDHLSLPASQGAKINCTLSDKSVCLAFYEPFSYVKRLRRAFLTE